MKRFKEIIEIEKENLPDYQFKFLYHRVLPGLLFFIVGGIIAVGLELTFSFIPELESFSFIPVAIWGIIALILLVLFVIFARKNSSRLLKDKTSEFEKKYELVNYEQAVEELAKENIIIDDNLIVDGKNYLLDDLWIVFFCKVYSGIYFMRLEFFKKEDLEPLISIELDRNLCTYFAKKSRHIVERELFELFLNNKREFLKLLFKYNDEGKMQKKYLKISKLCQDKEIKLKEHFSFLIADYDFRFDKKDLGNMVNKNGEFAFYGPLNCYYFYSENVCINFLHLVQRDEWYVYLTRVVSKDQVYIFNGKKIDDQFCYDWNSLVALIKSNPKSFFNID